MPTTRRFLAAPRCPTYCLTKDLVTDLNQASERMMRFLRMPGNAHTAEIPCCSPLSHFQINSICLTKGPVTDLNQASERMMRFLRMPGNAHTAEIPCCSPVSHLRISCLGAGRPFRRHISPITLLASSCLPTRYEKIYIFHNLSQKIAPPQCEGKLLFY
jgi:hypothetical protein